MKTFFLCFMMLLAGPWLGAQEQTEILIVGGGAGGTSAAIQAARMGAKVTVLERTTWLGGMLTSAGVSAIDGNHKMPSGIWGEFRDSLYARYGGPKAVATGWVSHTLFEPSVGNAVLKNMAQNPNIEVLYEAHYQTVAKKGGSWEVAYRHQGRQKRITATILVDATEIGELLPLVGAPFRLGMDSKEETQEKEAPEQANTIVQDLTYVAILEDVKTKKGRRGLVKKPKDYDAEAYACACKREGGQMFGSVSSCQQMLNYGKLPNDKYMINWPNCGNDFFVDWPNMNAVQREEALKKAKSFTQGFVYYIQNELGFANLRLAMDEFPTADGYPMIPYDREARRAKAQVFLTVNHLERPYDFGLYKTGVAVGDYPIDHHHDKNPDTPEIDFINIKVPSYNVPLGALIPENVPHFIVAEKNIGVSNIVNGATRLQPVVLGIGQAAGALAATSIKEGKPPAHVSVRSVQRALLADGAYLMPFMDVNKEDNAFGAMQRIGASGVFKGVGVPYKWANETWFYPERMVTERELWEGLLPLFPKLNTYAAPGAPLGQEALVRLLRQVDENITQKEVGAALHALSGDKDPEEGKPLTRRQVSWVVDALLKPFDLEVDFQGNMVR
ncbi:FAD-dependent oxidoreductase [Maribacter sp. 2307ULW6-5]|uniref:FAD-dependent oxidoreductase n=1 Tax=Maribacter sp. 2307ULW6-5 TaxID=3386275 RepID=UPI0039BCFE0D